MRQFTHGAASNAHTSGAPNAGTPGGRAVGKGGVNLPIVNEEVTWLWVLVILEVGLMAYMRNHFRRYHGG